MVKADAVKVHLRRTLALVVVARLEVALGSVELVGGQGGLGAVNSDAKLVILVRNLVGELGVEVLGGQDFADHLVAAVLRLLDAHGDLALAVVEQLADRFAADRIVNVDLPDNGAVGAVIGLCNHECGRQLVRGCLWVPRAQFAQFSTAVLGVCRRNAACGVGRAGNLHDHASVGGRGEEIVLVGVAIAGLELRRGYRGWLALGSNWELKVPGAQVKVSTRCTLRVQSGIGTGQDLGGRGCKSLESEGKESEES